MRRARGVVRGKAISSHALPSTSLARCTPGSTRPGPITTTRPAKMTAASRRPCRHANQARIPKNVVA